MATDLDSVLADIGTPGPKGVVRGDLAAKVSTRGDGSTYVNHTLQANSSTATAAVEEESRRADALFGTRLSGYPAIKNEKPAHRIMLWMALNGHTAKEIHLQTGYTYNWVCTVMKQPWFLDAFTRLSTEMGKDLVETTLKGEVVATCQTLVKLRDTAESEAVRLQASNAILDRIRGKPVAKTEMKVDGRVENVVYDVAKLEEEYRRNSEILASRGVTSGPN